MEGDFRISDSLANVFDTSERRIALRFSNAVIAEIHAALLNENRGIRTSETARGESTCGRNLGIIAKILW